MNKTTRTLVASAAFVFGTVGVTGVALAESPQGGADDLEVQVQLSEDGTVEDDTNNEGRRRGNRGRKLSVAAETIGIEVDDLRAGLQDDQSIAEIAEENGVAVQDVIDAMIDRVEENLGARVADGDMTEEEAAEKLASKTERIENRVNGVDNDSDDDADAEEVDA